MKPEPTPRCCGSPSPAAGERGSGGSAVCGIGHAEAAEELEHVVVELAAEPPRAARARSVVRMLTTAGPTFSTSSVKSGRPWARTGSGASDASRPSEARGRRRRGDRPASGGRGSMRHGRYPSRGDGGVTNAGERAIGAEARAYGFLRSSAAANIFSVAGGVSPMIVTHQSPWRCASVEVAPIAANIGLRMALGPIRLDEDRDVGQAVGVDALDHRRRRRRRPAASSGASIWRLTQLTWRKPGASWRMVQPSASSRVGVSTGLTTR